MLENDNCGLGVTPPLSQDVSSKQPFVSRGVDNHYHRSYGKERKYNITYEPRMLQEGALNRDHAIRELSLLIADPSASQTCPLRGTYRCRIFSSQKRTA